MKKIILIMILFSFTLAGGSVLNLESESAVKNSNDITVSSGSYDYLKGIYDNSQTSKMLPDKESLLAMVDEMTKPNPDNPNLAVSSNPYDYIAAHQDIYDELVSGGQNTVDIFAGILTNSNEFGLDKYIMAAVCAQITGIGNGSDKTWDSAKDWLILYDNSKKII